MLKEHKGKDKEYKWHSHSVCICFVSQRLGRLFQVHRSEGPFPCLCPGPLVSRCVHLACPSLFLALFLSLFSLFMVSSLCAPPPFPPVSPVTPQKVFVKDGRDHWGFLSLWPWRALHLPLTAWSITHKCVLLLFGSQLLAHGSTCLFPPLSLLQWAFLCWE